MMTPKKRPLLAFVRSLFSNPIVRGTLKSFPIGNWAYEIAENIKVAKDPGVNVGVKLPHSPVSLLVQAVVLGLIVYAFFTHEISISDVMEYIIPDDFKHFGGFGMPADSLSN